MNRRNFLTRATAAAVGALTLDPERLLWVPGQRSYFDIMRPATTVVYRWTYGLQRMSGDRAFVTSYASRPLLVDVGESVFLGGEPYEVRSVRWSGTPFDGNSARPT